MLEDALMQLLEMFHYELYKPLYNSLSSSDFVNEFINFINYLIQSIFGNASDYVFTVESLASGLTVSLLIYLVILFISFVFFIINIFKENLNERKKKKRR